MRLWGGGGGWKGPGFTGRCFVSGPFSRAKDTVNLKPVKLLFLTCSAADVTRVLFSYYTGGGVFKRRGGLTFDNEG